MRTPRPAPSVQTLSGKWLLALDPRNEGKAARWYERARPGARVAPVPGIIQQVFPDRYGVAWYWHSFHARLPEGAGRTLLRFGAVDYLTEVWLNGRHVGGHEGGETPFALDVTDALEPGAENLLAIRVLNPSIERIDGIVLPETPHRHKRVNFFSGAFYNYGGILLPVELARVPAVRVSEMFVRADPGSGRVRVGIAFQNDQGSAVEGDAVVSLATAGTGEVLVKKRLSAGLPAGSSERELRLHLARPRLWDLDDPFLYRAKVRLQSRAGSHCADVRFGFRELRVERGYFRLNGRRIFLRSTHTCNHYPVGQVVPSTPDFLRRDLLYAKASGFNTVRFIAGIAYPEQLDFCDEIGLMVYQETLAGWCLADSPRMAERYDRSLREMIRRDRNHPCVTIWGLLNETPDGAVFRHAVAFLPELRKLDDTRLVLLSSGRWDNDPSVGSLSNPGRVRWEHQWGREAPDAKAPPNPSDHIHGGYFAKAGDAHVYPPGPHPRGSLKFLRALGHDTKPVFLSEYGMGSQFNAIEELRMYEQAQASPHLPDASYIRAMRDRLLADWKRLHMEDAYPFPEDMLRESYALSVRQRRLGFDLVRSNPKLCGLNVTGMLDHGITGEGLWTFWREWKPGMLDAVRDGWSPLRWCLFIDPMHAYAGRPFVVEAVLANEEVLSPGNYPVTFRIFGPQGTVWEQRRTVRLRKRAEDEMPLAVPVLRERIALRLPPGTYTLAASLDRGGQPAGDRKEFYVSDPRQFPSPGGRVSVWGIDDRTRKWLERRGVRCLPFDGRQPSGPKDVILVGDPPCLKDPATVRLWKNLLARVANGGVAVFLSRLSSSADGENAMGFLPSAIGRHVEINDWLYHKDCVARPHPIFEGLPSPGVLDWDYYGDLLAHRYFEAREAPDETALAAFAVGHSSAPDGYLSGVMVGVYGLGRGRLILNALKVVDLLDHQPAADRLMLNLVRYAQATAGIAIPEGRRRFRRGQWASRYRPDPISAFQREWEITGPFDSVEPIKAAPRPPKETPWTPVKFTSDFISFHELHPGRGGRMYARRRIEAARNGRLKILLGTDGPCKIWLDGKTIGRVNDADNPAVRDRYAFPCMIRKGSHEILVAFERRGGNAWGFFFRFMQTDSR